MKPIHLEDFLRTNGNEYRLVVQATNETGLTIYIHPMNQDGETFDCYVNGDMTTEKECFDKLFKAVFNQSLHTIRKKMKK